MHHRASRTLTFATILGLSVAVGPRPAVAQSEGTWLPSVGFTVDAALGRLKTDWGLGATATLLRRAGRLAFGLEVGYQRFGTEVSVVDDFDGQPGSVLREEFGRSMLRLAGLARIDVRADSARPYVVAGVGAYQHRFTDRIEARYANGQRIPMYDYQNSGSDLSPGLTAGVGLELRRPTRPLGIAFEARWHSLLGFSPEDGLGTANFFSLGGALTW